MVFCGGGRGLHCHHGDSWGATTEQLPAWPLLTHLSSSPSTAPAGFLAPPPSSSSSPLLAAAAAAAITASFRCWIAAKSAAYCGAGSGVDGGREREDGRKEEETERTAWMMEGSGGRFPWAAH